MLNNIEEVETKKDNSLEEVKDIQSSKILLRNAIENLEKEGKVSRSTVVSLEELTGMRITNKIPASLFTVKESKQNVNKLLDVLKDNLEVLKAKESELPKKIDIINFNVIFKSLLKDLRTVVNNFNINEESFDNFINGRYITNPDAETYSELEVNYLDIPIKDFFFNFERFFLERTESDVYEKYESIREVLDFSDNLELLEDLVNGFPLYVLDLTNEYKRNYEPVTIRRLMTELYQKHNLKENIEIIYKDIKQTERYLLETGSINTIPNRKVLKTYRELKGSVDNQGSKILFDILDFFKYILK